MKRYTLSSQVYEVTDPLEAIEFYCREGITDSLPVVPPTPQRVVEFLKNGGQAPEVKAIGDCLQPRDIEMAVVEGHRVAIEL